MRWSCPHCGVSLAVPEEKVGTGWSFSRCYKCSGFALIRKPEINVIKVDQAPPGEKLLLPENADQFTHAVTTVATPPAQPVVRPASRRTQKPPNHPPSYYGDRSAKPAFARGFGLPDPLPELPRRGSPNWALTVAISLTGALAIGSGIYFYIQGQTLLHRAHTTVSTPAPTNIVPASNKQTAEQADTIADRIDTKAMAPTRLCDSAARDCNREQGN